MDNPEIAIVCLKHNRSYQDIFTTLLDKIKDKNKQLCQLYYLTTRENSIVINTNMDCKVINFQSPDNYGQKINFASNIQCKYIMKLDEDVFIGPNALDYMIENRHVLDNDDIVGLLPITNIGVPTCEYFIDTFCTPEEKNDIYDIFLKTDMSIVSKRWDNPDITSLNKYTLGANNWDFASFHEAVNSLDTIYKGIHPVRFNFEAQKYLCNLTINKMEQFLQKYDYKLFIPDICHNCNEISFHKQSTFQKIRDIYGFVPYEEVPISRYKRDFNLDFYAIQYAYCYTDLFAFNVYTAPNFDQERNILYTKFRQRLLEIV